MVKRTYKEQLGQQKNYIGYRNIGIHVNGDVSVSVYVSVLQVVY
jgi:hypothetical protein